MSINFYDDLVALDGRTALFTIDGQHITEMKQQAVTVEVNEIGEIKTMSDGTRYEVTAEGWVKL